MIANSPVIVLFQFWTNQFPYRVLTVASWSSYKFLRRQVSWSGIPFSLRAFHSLLWSTQSKAFSIISETEVDVFLEFPCFLYDPMNVGNLISGSSFFSKPSLDIWKFLVCIMLKPSIQDFKHDLTSMGDEWNCLMVTTFFNTTLLGIWDGDWPFLVYGHCYVFQLCWHIECNTLMASSFSYPLNSSTGIALHPLALLRAVLRKAHLTSHSRMSGSGWLTTPS